MTIKAVFQWERLPQVSSESGIQANAGSATCAPQNLEDREAELSPPNVRHPGSPVTPEHFDEIGVSADNTLGLQLGDSHNRHLQHCDIIRKWSDMHHHFCYPFGVETGFDFDGPVALGYASVRDRRANRGRRIAWNTNPSVSLYLQLIFAADK